MSVFEKNDWCRRVGMTGMKALRALVNTWNLYVPICTSTGCSPYNLHGKCWFTDRRKKSQSLLIILAGYREQVWEEVFERVERHVPADMDVCVVTSGRRVSRLEELCRKNHWSYLRTWRNHVCLIQNLAIQHHPEAQWIYKIDEDMFVTHGFFEKLREVYEKAADEQRYEVGFVAPLIPVNGYGHVRVLEKLNLSRLWEEKFGSLAFTAGIHHHTGILTSPECAKFMWGEGVPALADVDALNARFEKDGPVYTICPIRFSIGAILFSRATWKDFGMFPVVMGTGMGEDEFHLCSYCMSHSKAIVVAENSVVGHLGFGPQTKAMLEYYRMRRNS